MWLLSSKDGKPWWHKRDDRGNWIPVSEEEAVSYRNYWNDKRDEIAARIFNKMFNTEKDT